MSQDEYEFQFIIRCGGVDCLGDKLILYVLIHIKGINYRMSQIICEKAELDPSVRMGFISDEEVALIEDIVFNFVGFDFPAFMFNRNKDRETGKDIHLTSTDLFIANKDDVDLMKKTRSNRGIRHALGLKVRGQRTKTTGRGGQTIGVKRTKGV